MKVQLVTPPVVRCWRRCINWIQKRNTLLGMSIPNIIRWWTSAHEKAQENTSLMLKGDTKECVRRMKILDEAESSMLEYHTDAEAPLELKTYWAVRQDPACMHCRLSASIPLPHPTCAAKLSRFFSAREALYRYGKTLE